MDKKTVNKVPAWVILTIIALVAAALLGATNLATKDLIIQRELEAAEQARYTVLPEAESFDQKEIITEPEAEAAPADAEPSEEREEKEEAKEKEEVPDEAQGDSATKEDTNKEEKEPEYVYFGMKDDEIVGYVASVMVQGYGGEMDVTIGTDAKGKVTGVTVGEAKFSETPGLGSKAKDAKFTDQFVGKRLPIDKADIDAITGATITTNAVMRGVNDAGTRIADMAGFVVDANAMPENVTINGRTATVLMDEVETPFTLEITIDENSAISSIVYKTKDSIEEFDIASVSSDDLLALFNNSDTAQAIKDGIKGLSIAFGPSIIIEGNTATASADGFGGPVEVTLTIDDEGSIIELSVGGSQFAETPGYGTKAQDESFTNQFIGKSGTLVLGTDIDAIAGATITSKAVVEAVNKALAALRGEIIPIEPEEPALPKVSEVEGRKGFASKEGFKSMIRVDIATDLTGKVIAMEVGGASFEETPGIGTLVQEDDFIRQFIGQTGPFVIGENIDNIAGSTFSVQGTVDAANAALQNIQKELQESMAGGQTAFSSKEGYKSMIRVDITVDKEGTVIDMQVGGASFEETEGIGTKVLENSFINQFIGQTGPYVIGENIDGIAGATFSVDAVVAAANTAIDKINNGEGTPVAIEEPSDEPEPAPTESPAPAAALGDGVLTAFSSKEGYKSMIRVDITVDKDNNVVAMQVGGASFEETEGIGTKVLEDSFINQFIGQKGPYVIGENIDGIAGATFSVDAVVAAANTAIDKINNGEGTAVPQE